jgi:hypothetical protein
LSRSTQLEISNVNEGHLRQFHVPVNGFVRRRCHNGLRHSVAPGDASHELRKGLLLIWGHQDLRFLP